MQVIEINEKIPLKARADVLVAGGGVAGVSAAVSAARAGKKVILFEKYVQLGGLATSGLINFFVPMCNGRGVQIIKGLAEELLRLSIRYGYDTIPEDWQNGEPGFGKTTQRYVTRYSAPIFSIVLTKLLTDLGVTILFDTVVSKPVMNGKHCEGLIVENKSGRAYYEADIIIDATGDADVLARAGVPVVQGKNYHTYIGKQVTVDSCEKVVLTGDMRYLESDGGGGHANLYGGGHPEGMPYWKGTDGDDVTRYVTVNQLEMLENIKGEDRRRRTYMSLPIMPQFRTTRHMDADYTMQPTDTYRHFEDSIAAICDFERRDYLYEIPYRALVKTGFDNLICAGRVAAGDGYAWDCIRVIPPAILTGQAAGVAAAQALDTNKPIYAIDVAALQNMLAAQDVMIHFDDAWIPADDSDSVRVDVGEV